MTFGALDGDPRSAHDVQAEKSRVGLPNTEEISAKSPEARNGCGETSRSAAYAKRPRASVPAVRGPPNRPVGPASSNTGIQKCGRSDGHMVYPVSEIGTAGAGSNRSGFANVTGGAPSSADTRRSSQPRARSAAYRRDRKSTRLNSSHGYISYAVFCLKKKKTSHTTTLVR